jgi:hypothetical protein
VEDDGERVMISIGTNERLLILEVWEYFLSIETKVMMIMAMIKATLEAPTTRSVRTTVGAGWWRGR